ncbi:bet1-like protein [Senna tora]|uniref:Bet1-like protein n=1 Tax=Senna tora TaxID=362788 RepID=A0A834T829_9FABA|nr:bet1-like protein [Senna tora]
MVQVAEEIGTEVKYQKDFLEQLQMTMIKAQAGVKNNLRRLNKSIIQNGSNHIVHVVAFALLCFFVVYLWSKMSRK